MLPIANIGTHAASRIPEALDSDSDAEMAIAKRREQPTRLAERLSAAAAPEN